MSFHGNSITQLATDKTFDPRFGTTQTFKWKGTPTQIDALEVGYKALNYKTENQPSQEGGYSILNVYSGGEDSQDVWELDSNDEQKSLWVLPKIKAELDKIVEVTDKVKLKTDVDGLLRGARTTFDLNGLETDLTLGFILAFLNADGIAPGIDSTVIEDLIASFAEGDDYFPVSQTVLRHDTTLGTSSTVKASRRNVNKIFTTSELTFAEAITIDVAFELDDGFWLKRSPKCQRLSYGRWKISQEYWFAEAYNSFSLERQS